MPKEKEGSGSVCWLGSVPCLCVTSTSPKHSHNPLGGITVPWGGGETCCVKGLTQDWCNHRGTK